MADFFADPGAWFDQAGNDIAKFFDGDKAVESDNAAESDNAGKIADVISPLLEGGEGDDDLYGGTGVDFLHGWRGNDILDGRQGNDYLDGGSGNDRLTGGSGADIFRLSQGLDVSLTSSLLRTIASKWADFGALSLARSIFRNTILAASERQLCLRIFLVTPSLFMVPQESMSTIQLRWIMKGNINW